MHLTLWILRTSQAVFYDLAFFWLDGFAVPAPAQATQAVMQQIGLPLMQVTKTFKPKDRTEWRVWLQQYHATADEIWVLLNDRLEEPTISYLDAVEEAICFCWIDSIQKRHSTYERAQRFTPRKQRSN